MRKESLKMINSIVFEGMTSIRAILRSIDLGTNQRRIEKILYDTTKIKKISKELGYLKAVSEKYGYEVVESNSSDLEELVLGTSHGGIVALCTERKLPTLTKEDIKPNGFYAMIEGIEDPYNFGYALRSLYACGCDGIILGERNWMSAGGVVCRSSAGASELFKIYLSDELSCSELFKELGYKVVCADERTENLLGETELLYPILLIVGGEKRGISRKLLSSADILVKIPYGREFNASLSAASASTMFAYEIMRQNIK